MDIAGSCGCDDCRKVREHVGSLLGFRVVEAAAGKPLRIAGVAMAVGISRNFNVYTPDELAAFAEKLVGAPVYLGMWMFVQLSVRFQKAHMTQRLGVCFMRLKFTIQMLLRRFETA